MRKFLPLAVVTVALFLVLSVAPGAASSPPLAVTFQVHTTLGDDGVPNGGPFVASGPAVDAGLICSSGDSIDVSLKASGDESPKGVNYQIDKKFTCSDSANSFVAKMQIRVDRNGDNYSWIIIEGTRIALQAGVGMVPPGGPGGLHGSDLCRRRSGSAGHGRPRCLTSLMGQLWVERQPEVSPQDWLEVQRLCRPESPDFILDLPDYHGFFTYTVSRGRAPT